jgi:hypothetical protein
MSDVILVVLERQTAAAGLLRAAARLAELVGRARINVLGAAAPLPQDETTAMKNTFESWLTGVRGADFAVQWLSGEGTVEARIEESGRRADHRAPSGSQPPVDAGPTSGAASTSNNRGTQMKARIALSNRSAASSMVGTRR